MPAEARRENSGLTLLLHYASKSDRRRRVRNIAEIPTDAKTIAPLLSELRAGFGALRLSFGNERDARFAGRSTALPRRREMRGHRGRHRHAMSIPIGMSMRRAGCCNSNRLPVLSRQRHRCMRQITRAAVQTTSGSCQIEVSIQRRTALRALVHSSAAADMVTAVNRSASAWMHA